MARQGQGRFDRRQGAPEVLVARHALALVLASLFAPLLPGEGASEEAIPNIVLFLADDQTWIDSGAYGNPDLPTPNIDRLAREGMRFTHAFTGTAMCAPSRQQLYTGLQPVRSGAYPNHSVVRSDTRSLVHHFRDLGYRVGLTGKEHFGPPASFPFERVRMRSDSGDVSRTSVDLEAAKAFVARDAAQPFFLVVASNSPHTPWTEGDRSGFDADSIAVPGYLVDTPETRRALVEYYAEIKHLDEQLGEILAAIDASGRAGDTIVIYTSEQGASLPFAKWTLYDAGIRTAMVVRWPGQVAPGTQSDAMIQYVDVFPTLAEATQGRVDDVDGESFLSVLKGKRAEHREYVYGVQTTRGIIYGADYPIRSIRSRGYKLILNLLPANDFTNTISRPGRDGVLASWVRADPERARAYRNRPAVELYDLQEDPWERRNRADDPALSEVLETLRGRLEAWMQSNGDRGLETERAAFEHMNPRIVERVRARWGDEAFPTDDVGR